MGIGASVFLMAVGAILTFALEEEVEGIDLDTVGIILMIAGLVMLIATLLIYSGRRTRYVDEVEYRDPDGTVRRVRRDV